jgi:type IV secretion system protein VirD4
MWPSVEDYLADTPPPHRYVWWTRITIGLGALIAFLLVIHFLSTIGSLVQVGSEIGEWAELRADIRAENQIALWSAQRPGLYLALWLDLVAAAALAFLWKFKPDPAGWSSFQRFRLVLIAVAAVLGRPLGGLLAISVVNVLPEGWAWLTALVFAPVAPMVLAFGGILTFALTAMVVGALTAAIFYLALGLPLAVFTYLHNREIQKHVLDQQKAGLEAYIRRFAAWLRGGKLPQLPDDSKGSRFAAPSEAIALIDPDGLPFGYVGAPSQADSGGRAALLLKTDKHVLIQASTRSGKGVAVIIPHLLQHKGSAFVLDPKGENARATRRRRLALNGSVFVLDPFGISGFPSARFNPLARFTPANMEAESKALAAAFILGERDHWTAAAQQLLAGVILHVVTADAVKPEHRDLRTVRRLVLGDINGTLEAMAHNDAADGLIVDIATSFIKTPERERGSIISSAQRETEILDNPYITACLAAAGDTPEVDFAAWHRSTMTVYLCLSAPKFPQFNRWLRLVLTSALDEMTEQLDPPPVPICFILDELATLGHMAPVENAVGLAAGYGIQLVNVFQDVAQMRDLYKGRWASFIGNAGVRALFSLDDFDTADYWSRFLGGQVTESQSEQRDIWGVTSSRAASETVRPLLTPDEIMLRFASARDGAGKMLVLPQGARPIEAVRVPYFRDRRLEGQWDDPRVRPDPAKTETAATMTGYDPPPFLWDLH